MDNKRWLLDHGYIPSGTLSELMDLVMKEQRQMCADGVKLEGYRKNYVPKIHDYVDACLNATGEK